MIPDEVRNPRNHWTPVPTAAEAQAIAARCNEDEDVGVYSVEPKGAAYAVAYSEAGEFVAYI